MKISNLPPVSEMMRGAGLAPKKSLGQNFLFDLNLTDKIAKSVPDIENSTVVEIGPGPGGLTRSILLAGAPRVIVIEKDITTKPILDEIKNASDGRLEIIFADALKIFHNKEQSAKSEDNFLSSDFAICANLPYNIGTELLVRWLHMTPIPIKSMTLMFQREVAERIVAKPGDDAYGRLSVLIYFVGNAKIIIRVPRTAFTPAPKVESAVVQIIPKQKQIDKNILLKIESLTAKLFGQRRKMIRGIIKNIDWSAFGLTGTERAEDLIPEKFYEMAIANMI